MEILENKNKSNFHLKYLAGLSFQIFVFADLLLHYWLLMNVQQYP